MDFISKNLNGNEPPRCVDGRPDPKSPQGPQMLGGSLHPLVINAIISNSEFNVSAVENGLKKLKDAGFAIGAHWGSHRHEGKSDCGFADRLKDIIQTAKDGTDEILKRLRDIYTSNDIDPESLRTSYEHISSYDINNIRIIGKELVDLTIKNQAAFEELQGDHQEQAAFVNLKPDTTLDTQAINRQGKQAFNLDLWAAIEQLQSLAQSQDGDLMRDLSLILYMATEMVLVEQKGKLTLPIILNK